MRTTRRPMHNTHRGSGGIRNHVCTGEKSGCRMAAPAGWQIPRMGRIGQRGGRGVLPTAVGEIHRASHRGGEFPAFDAFCPPRFWISGGSYVAAGKRRLPIRFAQNGAGSRRYRVRDRSHWLKGRWPTGRPYWATDVSKGVIWITRRSMRFTHRGSGDIRNRVCDKSRCRKKPGGRRTAPSGRPIRPKGRFAKLGGRCVLLTAAQEIQRVSHR